MNALEVTNLVKTFGGLRATDDLSFHVAQGESVGLIGPNGAGKTTVFSQVMGDLAQTSGTITCFGTDVAKLSTPERIALGLGRTYQIPRPFGDLTVRENIGIGLLKNSVGAWFLGRSNADKESELALSVGLSLDDLDKPAGLLAMGDMRKLEFARTLATGARFLMLDEVFAGLSESEVETISELIHSLRKDGMSLLIVSHDIPEMRPLIDRAVAIERGRLIAEGAVDDVLSSQAVRAAYLGDA